MVRQLLMVFAGVFVAFSLNCSASSQTGDIDKLVGDWSGKSICVNKEKYPACNDEVVVYHIKKVEGKTNTINLSADTIVNGKPDNMGNYDFIYDPKKQTLMTEYKNDRVHFTIEFDVKGDVLEGGMYSYPERTQARRMKVTKSK